MTSALHSGSEAPLMFCAGASLPARANPTMFGYVTTQCVDVLVIDGINLVYTEGADTAPPEPSSSTTKISHFSLQLE